MSETFEDRMEMQEWPEKAEKRDQLRLSREERDHIAGHALDSIHDRAGRLRVSIPKGLPGASDKAREIAALSNLLGDIGWEREQPNCDHLWFTGLGQLFPVAQLRPWLEEWQRQDDEALAQVERELEAERLSVPNGSGMEGRLRQRIADAQTELGTGAILLARIEKWMASHGN